MENNYNKLDTSCYRCCRYNRCLSKKYLDSMEIEENGDNENHVNKLAKMRVTTREDVSRTTCTSNSCGVGDSGHKQSREFLPKMLILGLLACLILKDGHSTSAAFTTGQ